MTTGGRVALAVAIAAFIDASLVGAAAWLYMRPPVHDESAARREAAAYRAYRQLFSPMQPGPAECRTDAELDALTAALAGPLAPPAEYARHWRDTPEVRLHGKWLVDVELLRGSRKEAVQWYRERIDRGTELLLEPVYNAAWAARTAGLAAEYTPWPPGMPISGSPSVPHRRGAALTFADVARGDAVERAAADWEQTRRRLTGLPDLLEMIELVARQVGVWPLLLYPN